MHNDYLLAALEQAWLGRGSCAPNPSVGAVVVQHGEIIARAWHRGAGTAHAEQLLLEQIPSGLQNLTLYVTLEPCNHWGRTPPCVATIVEYGGISQVVYGFCDPNPIVKGNDTPALLQKKGIKAIHHPLPDIDRFYQSYRYWMLTKKPWVTFKVAQTLDGKIAGAKGEPRQLSNTDCAEFTHKNRLHADVILTTEKTIKQDDPLLNVRLKGLEQSKPLAIIDSRLSLDNKAKVLTSAKHCHIYYDEQYSLTNPLPNCSYYAVSSKEGLLDLAAIINHLGSLGYHDVWVEAGGRLFSVMHQENQVQRTYLYLVPTVLGSDATMLFHGDDILTNKSTLSWQIKGDNVIACFDWQENRCLQD